MMDFLESCFGDNHKNMFFFSSFLFENSNVITFLLSLRRGGVDRLVNSVTQKEYLS